MAKKVNDSQTTKLDIEQSNKIVLRSVNGKVGIEYKIQPSKDPRTGRYADSVKKVDSHNDLILSEEDKKKDPDEFIKESDVFTIVDGTTFNLDDTRERAIWEAIKHCKLIAPDRYAKDSNGNLLIDGTMGWSSHQPRFGIAELYVERPGEEAVRRVSKKKKIFDACQFIYTDSRGYDGRVKMARLLGKNMTNMPDADITDYLIQLAEKDPDKIINLYTGGDLSIRLLFVDAREKHIINFKNKLYIYSDNVVLGATDEAAILYLKDPKHKNLLDLIKRDTYPELMED